MCPKFLGFKYNCKMTAGANNLPSHTWSSRRMSDDYISDRNLWNIQYFGAIVEANYDRADMEKLLLCMY